MDDQATRTAPTAPNNNPAKPSLLLIWLAVSAFIVIAAYMQNAGLLRLAAFTQLFSGYDVFSFKRFDVPRLPPSKNFEIVGQKGGKLSAIVIRGNYAYVGSGESLMVLDISNPKKLEVIDSLLLLGQITDIELDGKYAYVCNGRGGLRIVDISNAAQLKEVAAYGYMAVPKNAAVASGYAYIASGMKGLEVLDVTNPARPVAVSFEDSAEGSGTLDALSICIAGDRLCVMDEDQGLRLFDIKDPRNPRKLQEWKAGGRGLRRGAAAVDEKAILIAGDSPDEGVSLLDIEGSKPVLTASLDIPQYWYGSAAKIRDSFAFIGTSSGLLIVDIHEKKKPARLSEFDKVPGIIDLDVKGNTVYATTTNGALAIIDVSDPYTPVLVSEHQVAGDAQSLAMIDGHLYSTSGRSEIQSLRLPLDEKTMPAVQTFAFKDVRDLCQAGNDIAIAEDRYPARGSRTSLVTLLRREPEGTLKEAWSQIVDKPNREVSATEKYVFAAAVDGIHIFNKSGSKRFFYPLKTGADLLCADGDRLYVVTETGPKETSLLAFDAQDPEHLKKLGQISIDQRGWALVTDLRHIYILEGGVWGDRELSILEKTADGAPRRISSLKVKHADRLAIDGNRVYIQGFLQVNSVDINDPKNPKLIGTVDLSAIPLSASDIDAKNGTVYIAGQDGGVYIIKDKTVM